MTKFGPRRLKTLATRPAMMLPSSPGIVSSVITGSQASQRCRQLARRSPRAPPSAARANWRRASSSRANSGKLMRSAVR